MNYIKILFFVFFIIPVTLFSQTKVSTYVDKSGILRWANDKAEVCEFGVNYTLPFAYAYRALDSLGVKHETAIENDVYHLARLGLTAFRVHVWDCEISDTIGNLLDNDHLRLLDYTIKTMKDRGFKFVITPLAFWGNGYPERDTKMPGFSAKYGKDNCLINPDAIKAQEKYLNQFVNHINRYTGIAYKDEPDIVAFEICNEPLHKGDTANTTNYINRMVKSIRNTGCEKPLYYCMAFASTHLNVFLNANVQGGSVQSYPLGLVAGHTLQGNLLPRVSMWPKYQITQKIQEAKKGLLIYEFDAADNGYSHLYAPIAKGFREAGFQFATQFAYDPMALAPYNTEYQTHYMNLAYAPRRALGLKIAGEAFHKIPRGKSFGNYPQNVLFDSFRVSYPEDLAEMATDTKFMYSNNTSTQPSKPEKLTEIAGYGSSPIVAYEGYGAYFLDKLDNGIWRLELMPDDIWVRDPFMPTSLKREVSVIIHNQWPISVNLPNIGENFSVTGINSGNTLNTQANGITFSVLPGTYFLVKKEVINKYKSTDKWKNIMLNEYVAPPTNCNKTYVLHNPVEELSEGSPLRIEALVVSPASYDSVMLFISGSGFRSRPIVMTKGKGYRYFADVPQESLKEGILNYYIVVKKNGVYNTYPSGNTDKPNDWDFYDEQRYKTLIVKPNSAICLFDSYTDGSMLIRPEKTARINFMPSPTPGKTMVAMTNGDLQSCSFFFKNKISGRMADIDKKAELVITGRSKSEKPESVIISVVTSDGSAWGDTVTIMSTYGQYTLMVKSFRKVKQYQKMAGRDVEITPAEADNSENTTLVLKNIESIHLRLVNKDGSGILFENVELK